MKITSHRQQYQLLKFFALVVGIVRCLTCIDATTSTPSSTSSKTSIPRTVQLPGASLNGENTDNIHFPPWNPSPLIDENGFLISKYRLIPGIWELDSMGKRRRLLQPASSSTKKSKGISLSRGPATIRQVPGDGNCLFHSISTCYAYAVNGTHIDLRNPSNMRWLYQQSTRFRQLAVDCLEGEFHTEPNRKLLFLHGQDYLTCHDLVEAAASPYGISGKEYCQLMRQNSYWGGGPEIVALCNVLERPIHVYELHVPKKTTARRKKPSRLAFLFSSQRKQEQQLPPQQKGNNGASSSSHSRRDDSTTTTSFGDDDDDDTTKSFFVLRRMACFGSPKFDRQTPLHILSVDSRFPDISPGKQLPSGNHFMAIFPHDNNDVVTSKKKTRIRGGAGCNVEDDDDDEEEDCLDGYDDVDDEPTGWWSRFWSFW